MKDNGSSVVIAGLLCVLLTGFLCCGEPPRAPVSAAEPSGGGALVSGRVHQRRSRRPAKAKPPAPVPQEDGGSDTRTGGGRVKV